jgi:nucleoside-diphosphate-sugar epimerase
MRVLITGGGGNLGRVLAPSLAEAGHEAVLMDYRALDTPYESIRAELKNKTEVLSYDSRARKTPRRARGHRR